LGRASSKADIPKGFQPTRLRSWIESNREGFCFEQSV
jgi:hypothetical protein